MKKVLVFASLLVLLAGCRERSIFGILGLVDQDEINRFLSEDVDVVTVPEDNGATVDVYLNAALPTGLSGISVYVDTSDMTGLPGDDIAAFLVADGVTEDTTIQVQSLANGQGYNVETRGRRDDNTVTMTGIGGKFYPRPWGQGSYLGFDPNDPPDGATDNALAFNRTSGDMSSLSMSSAVDQVDFMCYYDAGVVYFTDAVGYGGHDNKVAFAEVPAEKWLDVQEAPATYSDTVPLEMGDVYHFKTYDDYYGKFVVEDIEVDLVNFSVNLVIKYAFQTAQGVHFY